MIKLKKFDFFFPIQFFNFHFPFQSFAFPRVGFGIDKAERGASAQIFGALAAFMGGQPIRQVVGDAGIQGVVGAAENVNGPVHA